MRSKLVCCSLCLLSLCAFGEDTPLLSGYVTRFVSLQDFDVNGRRVILDRGADVHFKPLNGLEMKPDGTTPLYVGEPVVVYGSEQRKAHTIKVTEMEIARPVQHAAEGVAVVEAVRPGKTTVVRADGYDLRLDGKTQVKYEAPLQGPADVAAGVWVRYKGAVQANGDVLVQSASFRKVEVSNSLRELRTTWEYDPKATPADARQSGASRAFRGRDASYFPPYPDAAAQARVEAIGGRLVPAFEKEPAWADRLNMRFYVVDAPGVKQVFPLPSGIVLVPYEVVHRLENDSELAAVLADAVACLIEGQPIALPATNGKLAATAGFTAAEFIPIVGLGVGGFGIEQGISGAVQARRNMEQRARVSLRLLQEGGFDVTAAPTAWWALSLKGTKAMDDTNPPGYAGIQYPYLSEMQAGRAGSIVDLQAK